jgi:hypothetical protein
MIHKTEKVYKETLKYNLAIWNIIFEKIKYPTNITEKSIDDYYDTVLDALDNKISYSEVELEKYLKIF